MNTATRELAELTAIRRCILACQDAGDACARAIGPAVKDNLPPAYVSLLQDALATCAMTAAMVGRGSRFRDAHVLINIEICDACALSAASYGNESVRNALTACAESGRDLLGVFAPGAEAEPPAEAQAAVGC